MSPLAHFRPNRRRRSARGFLGLRALIACLIALLQLTSVLHFTLVPHTFSAALGGVVHVHGGKAASAEPQRVAHTPAALPSTASCAVDVCPYADAPSSSLPCEPAELSGLVSFGEARLLAKAEARAERARLLFPSAPKTSPPV